MSPQSFRRVGEEVCNLPDPSKVRILHFVIGFLQSDTPDEKRKLEDLRATIAEEARYESARQQKG